MSGSPESNIFSIEEKANLINKSYKGNTDLIGKGVDKLVGIFGGETVEKIYKDQIGEIQQEAKTLLVKLHSETLTQEQRMRLERLREGKLEDVGIIQMTKNTDLKQAVVNSAYGVKGEITGTLHGLKVMITGVFDLAIFMGKYAGSMLGIHPEYKTKINEQATQLFDWMKKEGRVGIQDKVFELIEQEMIRISTLPQEDQAEAIGNIAGNIIGMLTGIKAGITLASKSGEMAGKVAQVARITEKLAKRATVNTARITHVGNLGKQAGYIRMGATVAEKTLNGVAESLIGYGFAKGLSVTWGLISNSTISASKKLSAIEKTLAEMEEALKTETNISQRNAIQEEIQKLREEKVKIQRPDQNLDELKANSSLLPDARIEKTKSLLGGKILSEEQKSIILHIHKNMSKGIFGNNYSDLRKMTSLLEENSFQPEEIRILMENGILGFGLRSVSRTDGISDYAIGKLHRIELPEERIKRGGMYGYSKMNSDADKQIARLREQVQQNKRKVLRDHERIEKKEVILENAKQVGAKLFVLGEDIMKQNPNLTGAELKELILKKASENKMKVSSYQHRVLERQADIYDDLKLKRDEKLKGWFDKVGIEMPKEVKLVQNLLRTHDELNYQIWKDLFGDKMTTNEILMNLTTSSFLDLYKSLKLVEVVDLDSELLKKGLAVTNNKVTHLIISKRIIGEESCITVSELEKKFNSKAIEYSGLREALLRDIHQLQKGVEVEIESHPLSLEIVTSEFALQLQNGSHSPNRLGLYTGDLEIFSIRAISSSDAENLSNTMDHEYQHLLSRNFLNPDIFDEAWPKNQGGVDIGKINKRAGREVYAGDKYHYNYNSENIRGKIWQSMQDELCSYIERNGQLPKNINPYLDGGLKNKLKNGEIPREDIGEIEGAIRELELYFNNPKVSREDFVGIIRTSYSIEDMLSRLRKKYIHILPNGPHKQLLKILSN